MISRRTLHRHIRWIRTFCPRDGLIHVFQKNPSVQPRPPVVCDGLFSAHHHPGRLPAPQTPLRVQPRSHARVQQRRNRVPGRLRQKVFLQFRRLSRRHVIPKLADRRHRTARPANHHGYRRRRRRHRVGIQPGLRPRQQPGRGRSPLQRDTPRPHPQRRTLNTARRNPQTTRG